MTVKFLGADDLFAGILAVSTDLGVTLSEDHADLEVTVIQREEDISAASISSSKAQILYGGGNPDFSEVWFCL